jgi:hypothetical protein
MSGFAIGNRRENGDLRKTRLQSRPILAFDLTETICDVIVKKHVAMWSIRRIDAEAEGYHGARML